jgi:uncharacterized protein
MADNARPGAPARPVCPMCGRPSQPRFRPFCSPRCRDQDLLNWLDGYYAVLAAETEEDDADRGEDQGG